MRNPLANSIVLLGPAGATFSHRAWATAAKTFEIAWDDDQSTIVPVAKNPDILQHLLERQGSYGIIAAETEVRGRVNESVESFTQLIAKYNNGDCPIQIIGAVRMPLSFALMVRPGTTFANLKGVLGHPQALAACETNLKKRTLTGVETTSNGRAAEMVAIEPQYAEYAALAPAEAADRFGLQIIHAQFEDAEAITTFFVLGAASHLVKPRGSNRALIIFRLKDGPMALANAITPFGQMGLSLTYVHSFHNSARTYDFLAEIDCGEEQVGDLRLALQVFGRVTMRSIVFGPFPVVNV